MRQVVGLVLGVWLSGACGAVVAGPIRYQGADAELSLFAISDNTFQITLAPLDREGKPRGASPSTVLFDLKRDRKLSRRELTGPEPGGMASPGCTRMMEDLAHHLLITGCLYRGSFRLVLQLPIGADHPS